MITLITGLPGSGKTLYTVGLIKKHLADNRPVYSDIEGLNIPGVLPSPDNWQDTPEGSVVVYDECQRIFPSTGKPGVAEDARIRAMETHRHTGHDLIFITQAPSFVHAHIRKLVGKHHHVFRAMGLKSATVYTWDGVCNTPNDKKEHRTANIQRWSYPVKDFESYKSATVHTHKFSLPSKFIWIGLAALVIIGTALYTGSDSFLAKAVTTESATITPPQTPVSPGEAGEGGGGFNNSIHQALESLTPVTVTLSGCMLSSRHNRCRCWDSKGMPVDIQQSTCMNILEGNEPLSIALSNPNIGGSKNEGSEGK